MYDGLSPPMLQLHVGGHLLHLDGGDVHVLLFYLVPTVGGNTAGYIWYFIWYL